MPRNKERQQPKKKIARSSWAATLSLFGCLLVALVAGSPRWTPLLDGREAAATVSALPSMASSSGAQPRLITKPIEEIRCGDRIPSELPDGLLPDDQSEPDPATWRLVELEVTRPNGDLVEVKLLRPQAWLQQAGAIDHGTFPINVEELDIEGDAAVLQVLPCPLIQQGEGQVVTGTFRHTCDEFVHLHIDGEPAPITCTTGHPIWSEDRQDFIPASDLQPEETVRLASGTFSKVSLIKYESGSRDVFNFEVNRTHVYHVGTTGLLTHNAAQTCGTVSRNNVGGVFENSVKRTFRKKIIRQNERLRDKLGREIGEIDFETAEALVEVGSSLKGKLPQLHKLAGIAVQRGKRLDVIYGPDTSPGTLRALQESLLKRYGNRVRFIPHPF